MLGMERIGIPNVSPSAFREALANALTHRDYTRLGVVHVQWPRCTGSPPEPPRGCCGNSEKVAR